MSKSIFDILGIIDLSLPKKPPNLPEDVFCSGPWNQATGFERRSISGRSFQIVYLHRSTTGGNCHTRTDKHFLTVGEVSPNALWTQEMDVQDYATSRLPAMELLRLYEDKGDDFLGYVKGNFTLIFLDEDAGKCSLFNSRFGISPFYYAMDGLRFIFSTSLAAIKRCFSSEPLLDATAVAELAIFNYPLGSRTYFRNVKMLRPAEVIHADSGGTKSKIYWDVRTLYEVSQYDKRDALEIGAELFHKTVNNAISDVEKVRISFTSGFDSRMMLSVLEKEPQDYLCYSFGIPDSLNVTIPKQISDQLGFSYHPIVLDETYESVFNEYAMRAVLLTDCLSTVERANYPYAFEQLSDFSPVVLTGIFGSELMRSFQNIGHIISAGFARLNMADDPQTELRKMLADQDITRYFSPDVIARAVDEIESDIHDMMIQRFGKMSSDRRFYMLLLTEALRKYFGPEVHMERLYGINRFPFMDDEFVDFMFHAPFAGVYSRTLRPTVSNRYQSQYFYAYVIRKYRPELLTA